MGSQRVAGGRRAAKTTGSSNGEPTPEGSQISLPIGCDPSGGVDLLPLASGGIAPLNSRLPFAIPSGSNAFVPLNGEPIHHWKKLPPLSRASIHSNLWGRASATRPSGGDSAQFLPKRPISHPVRELRLPGSRPTIADPSVDMRKRPRVNKPWASVCDDTLERPIGCRKRPPLL